MTEIILVIDPKQYMLQSYRTAQAIEIGRGALNAAHHSLDQSADAMTTGSRLPASVTSQPPPSRTWQVDAPAFPPPWHPGGGLIAGYSYVAPESSPFEFSVAVFYGTGGGKSGKALQP